MYGARARALTEEESSDDAIHLSVKLSGGTDMAT